MQQMYLDYKDVVEFYMVYISEAHALDDRFPVDYAKELGIKEHTKFGERCTVASRLRLDKALTIPCLVDDMDNAVAKSYSAWPDRVFLVGKDGVLAVAAKRGPWGFEPALDKVGTWLASYKDTGAEPPLPEPGEEEPDFFDMAADVSDAYRSGDFAEALSVAEQMHELRPSAIDPMYNIACMHCLLGHKKQSYTWLEKAIDAGYGDADHLLADDDFKSIRSERRFKELVQRTREKGKRRASNSPRAVAGKWSMKTNFGRGTIDATMTLTTKDGKLVGTWASQGGDMKLADLKYTDGTLSFTRTIPGGPTLTFKGTVSGDSIKGRYTGGYRELECTGQR